MTEERLLGWRRSLIERWGWLLPSLSDAAFFMPIAVLFFATTGVPWLLSDSDTGWHIRTGEWILQNGYIPTRDLFSFTKPGQPWFAWEWLADLVMGWLHSHGGLAAVVWASFVILCATSLLLYRATVEESEQRLVSFLLTWIAMGASTVHWLARPHLITPLLALVFCRILNRVEQGRNRTMLVALPALTVAWVNLHGGFFVGLALILTYSAAAAGEGLFGFGRDGGWSRARLYLVTAGACLLASLLNPYRHHLHSHVLEYLGSPFYLQHIEEFRPVNFQWLSASYFETLLVLAFGSALWHLGKKRLVHVLLPLGWGHLALLSARNVPIFAVVTLPGIGLAIKEWVGFARHEWRDTRIEASVEALETVEIDLRRVAYQRGWQLRSFPALGLVVIALFLAHPGRMSRMRAEFDATRFPVEATAVVQQEEGSSPRLFCSWQWGGYLIYRLWPSIYVFQDGRTDFYGPALVKEGLSVWNASRDWERILEGHHITAALLPVDSALVSVLRERKDWVAAYEDRVSVLFQKRQEGRRTRRNSRSLDRLDLHRRDYKRRNNVEKVERENRPLHPGSGPRGREKTRADRRVATYTTG